MTARNRPNTPCRLVWPALLLPLTLSALAAGPAHKACAQSPALAVRAASSLTFGKIAVLGQSGMISIDAASGGKSTGGGAIDLGGSSGSARLEIGGPANGLVRLTPLPARMHGPRGGMLTFTPSFSTQVITLDANGRASCGLGGEIALSPAAPAGIYTGQILLEVGLLSCSQKENCNSDITSTTRFSLDFDFQ